jgi:hypothetical protein
MSKNTLTSEITSSINNTVNAVVAMVATTPKAVRATNRTYRPVLISAAYALYNRNGKVTPMNLFTVVEGQTVASIKATVQSIRGEISRNKVAANTAKVIALTDKLRAQAAEDTAAKAENVA